MSSTIKGISKQTSDRIHIFLIGIMLIGIVCSKFLMSVTLFLCIGNLLLEMDFRSYWKRIKENHLLHLILGFYLLHLLSLFWSENIAYGLNDLRIKAPLFVIPVILIAKPIAKANLKWLYLLLIVSLLITSLINFCSYQFSLANHTAIDIRELSLFGSHIRYGMLLSFGLGVCFFLSREIKKYSIIWICIGAWFIFYTYYSQVLSGLLALLVVITILVIFHLKDRKWVLFSGFTLVILGISAILFFIFTPKTTAHKQANNIVEMRSAWNQRSPYAFDSLDLKKQPLKTTLTRYLDSKELPHNGPGLSALSENDVHNIENGCADVHETGFGFMARMYGLRYQIQHSTNPNGHSLLQRFESWHTAWQIVQKNWLFGAGAGDVADEFEKKYNENRSVLIKENRIRAHNSYLTYCLSFGVFGLLIFVYLQFAFLFKQYKEMNYLGILFLSVSIVSFLLEDTLETQTGVTFFAFFYALYAIKETRLNDN